MKVKRARILIKATSLASSTAMFNSAQSFILTCLQGIKIMTWTADGPFSAIELTRISFTTLPAFMRHLRRYVLRAKGFLLEIQPKLMNPIASIGRRCAESPGYCPETESLLNKRLKHGLFHALNNSMGEVRCI
jgi:hypothetical protein